MRKNHIGYRLAFSLINMLIKEKKTKGEEEKKRKSEKAERERRAR